MLPRVIFIVGFIILLTGLLLVKKTSEKVSFFRSLIICYITELCIGAVLAGVYALVNIPIDILSMGIGYLLLGFICMTINVWRREIQRYGIYKVDIYSFIIITLFFCICFLLVFGTDIELVYKNSDPATHFRMALSVMKTHKIERMYFAPLFNSLFMELLQPFMAEISLYKAFILADSFSNYINILMFYVLLSTIFKSRFSKVVAPVICMLYFLGWPFYSWVAGGYVYFGIGITLFAYVIYLLVLLYQNENSNIISYDIVLITLMALGTFGVTICYMLFTPILCGVIFIVGIIILRRRNISFSVKWLCTACSLILILGIILFAVCFFGYFKGDVSVIFKSLQLEGGIHREPYKDFIFLCPFFIYMGWNYYKKKETDVIYLASLFTVGVTLFAFILCLAGVMSGYYYYKLYYLNWFLNWLVCAQAIEQLYQKKKIVLYAYCLPVALAVAVLFSGVEDYFKRRDLQNKDSMSLFPIYSVTKDYMLNSKETEEMSALRSVAVYINDNYSNLECGVPLICSMDKYIYPYWYYNFTGYEGFFVSRSSEGAGTLKDALSSFDDEEYFLILKTTDCYQENYSLLDTYKCLYDDGYFGLYQIN